MKKHMIVLAACVLAMSAAALAQPLLSDAPHRSSFEISLYGGFSLSQIKGTTNYQDQWGWNLLQNVNEQTAIATSAKTGYAAGGELAFYFTPNFGIQALFSYAKMDVPNSADCSFAWTWTTDGTSHSQTATWPGTGSFSSTPLSLDLVGRVSAGQLDGTFSAGVTLFMNSFTQSSSFGYGITTITTNSDGYTQRVDALQVGLMIPTSAMKKTIVGFNIGGALTWMLSDTIGIRADARYYYCPQQTLSWSFVQGTYNGVFFGEIQNEPFDSNDIALLQQTSNSFTMRVNPSFIHLTLGLVFSFGGGR